MTALASSIRRAALRILPLVLLVACGAATDKRPLAATPPGWHHWVKGALVFDGPPDWSVTTRPVLRDSVDVFLSRQENGKERCVLVLRLSAMPRFPAMERMKPFAGQAYDTQIGGAWARRIDAPEAQFPGTSEGVIELGDSGPARRVHFQYANLDAPTRQAAEQVLASLRARAPRA